MTKEEAIKIINCYDIGFYDLSGEKISADKLAEAFNMAIEALKERPTGKWAYEKINSYSERIYCSECGSQAPFVYVADDHYGRLAHGEIRKTNFCPNCGADMRGGETVPLYFKRGVDDET